VSVKTPAKRCPLADAVYKVTAFLHNNKGHYWENVFHYSVTGASADDSGFATALALADAWDTKMSVPFLKCMGNDTTLDVVAATRVSPGPGTTATSIDGNQSTSLVSGQSSGVACNVTWVDGGDTGRFSKTFVGNVPENALSEDLFSDPYIALIDTWAQLMTGLLALGAGKGDATFVHYVKKTDARYAIVVANVADKATMLNKRTVPNH
jgi:hypothetical protein